MAVTAPFQFARIPRAVWFPDWGHLVSHDVPFADGYSGTIEIEIEAMTPLLIGGERRAATDARPGEVWPMQLPTVDGEPAQYAIPGSSLQGMIRSILEIACFGKLGPWVDQRRFGIRDISGSATGKAAYGSRMTKKTGGVIHPQTKAGWLQRAADGNLTITPCEYARIDAANIGTLGTAFCYPTLQATLTSKSEANERYAAFLGLTNDKANLKVQITVSPATNAAHSCGAIWYTHCTAGGTQSGQIVFTGKPVGGDHARRKHFEFVFFDKIGAVPIPIPDPVWRDFDLIHSPPKGSGQKENPNWTYWKADFANGEPVPIFYIEDVDASGRPINNTVAAMGTAFMFKLAHKNDTHQMLHNSSASHTNKTDYDLASLIFGGVGDGTDSAKNWLPHSLKRRASFDWAMATLPDDKDVETGKANGTPRAAILLSPKPSYYPIYVRQPTDLNSLYATYTPAKRRRETDNHPHTDSDEEAVVRNWPELSGAKIWPNAGKSLFSAMPDLPVGTTKVQSELNALPVGTVFSTKLHVHNLRKIELNALLWALTFGEEGAVSANKSQIGKCHHRLGMGKPLGLGEVKMAVRNAELTANSAPHEPIGLDALKAMVSNHSFCQSMDAACAELATSDQSWLWRGDTGAPDAVNWVETSQVKALLKSALPNPGQSLGYMPLQGNDGYIEQRKANEAIPPLADGWDLSSTHNAAQVAFAAPHPGQHGGGQQNRGQNNRGDGGNNRHNNNHNRNNRGGGGGNQAGDRNQATARQANPHTPNANAGGFLFVEDAPITRNSDGATGFLRAPAHGGALQASFNGGPPEPINPNQVTVTGPPEEG